MRHQAFSWPGSLSQIHDIEAKYYADSEDAYDMRKYFPNSKKCKANALTSPDKLAMQVNQIQLADSERCASHKLLVYIHWNITVMHWLLHCSHSGGEESVNPKVETKKRQPDNTLDGEHAVEEAVEADWVWYQDAGLFYLKVWARLALNDDRKFKWYDDDDG